MNDNVQPELDREIELLLEQTGLFRFVGAVVNVGFDFFFRRALQRLREYLRLALLRQFHARQSMIIETGFTDRDDAPAFRQFAQRVDDIVPRLFRVGRDERR